MEDLSLHILDIAENSVRAGADLIRIIINEDTAKDLLEIEIEDNGRGMSAEELKKALNPFYTTKENKKTGLGLSLFSEAARLAGGNLTIRSQEKEGAKIRAVFQFSHIDRKPLGNIRETLETLIMGNPDVDFVYQHSKDDKKIFLDTREIRSGNDSSVMISMVKKIRQLFENEWK